MVFGATILETIVSSCSILSRLLVDNPPPRLCLHEREKLRLRGSHSSGPGKGACVHIIYIYIYIYMHQLPYPYNSVNCQPGSACHTGWEEPQLQHWPWYTSLRDRYSRPRNHTRPRPRPRRASAAARVTRAMAKHCTFMDQGR